VYDVIISVELLGDIINNFGTITLSIVLSASISNFALSSDAGMPVDEGLTKRTPSGTAAESSELLKIFPSLPRDMQRYVQSYHIDNINDLHKKDEAMYRLGLVNKNNWAVYEQIAFNPADIIKFAEQAVAPAFRGKFSKKDVIEYFGLDTTIGRMKFRKMMDAGMPELLGSRKLSGAFNSAYFEVRDTILKTSPDDLRITFRELPLKLLPREIGRLKKLTILSLERNQLIWLPAELGKLTNLEELRLGGNQLTSLPAELGNLTNLTNLNLNGNQLTWLPAELGKLASLDRLSLTNNKLTSVPGVLGKLTNLGGLWLGDNQLTSVSTELGNLTNLKTLVLSNNQLTLLPAELGYLTNLTSISLDGNQLTSVPAELGKLTNLVNLYLGNNPLLKILPASLSPKNQRKYILRIVGFDGEFELAD
jgi:hypothetical protein